jgi:hypothetical protein
MCDLWRHTTFDDTPPGAIAAQVAGARNELHRRHDLVRQMKLYNASSFFDPRAVPETDYEPVAAALAGLKWVTVESHPALISARTVRFLDALQRHRTAALPAPELEVAMGLETAHPEALDRLHKRITVDGFVRAADRLRDLGIGLRVFLLVSPPFVPQTEQDAWLLRSLDVAFACGASVVSLIPTRPGNGAMETLAEAGWFRPPRLVDLERSLTLALARRSRPDQRVLADLWDLDRLADCPQCVDVRRSRLRAMNLEQRDRPPALCPHCGAGRE